MLVYQRVFLLALGNKSSSWVFSPEPRSLLLGTSGSSKPSFPNPQAVPKGLSPAMKQGRAPNIRNFYVFQEEDKFRGFLKWIPKTIGFNTKS